MTDHKLEVKNVSKSFPGVKALVDVSIYIDKGEIISLVGENGAGKSTLINVISGQIQPDVGSVSIDGKEVKLNSPTDAIHLGVGLVPQELNLIPQLSVAENIYLGIRKVKPGVIPSIDWKRMRVDAEEVLASLGVKMDVTKVVESMSVARAQGFADLSQLRRSVMEQAVAKKQTEAAEQFANDLIRQVLEGMEVQLPDAMVENQLDGLIQELRGHLESQGMQLEQYLEASGASMEDLRAHAREQAVSAARFELAMTEIARLEGIDVTDEDVEQKYGELSAQYQLSRDLLRQQLPPMRLRHDLKLARAQAVVVDTARRR